MSSISIISLVAMALVFVVWAFFMFRALWLIAQETGRRQEKSDSGYFRRASHSLASYRAFVTEPEHKDRRRHLSLLTGLLILVILGRTALLTNFA